jgi:tryptophan 2,3-dioxygenase
MSLTYSHYLKVPELLQLQSPQSDPPEHDETLFIIIHQVYELWFKLLLHEFDKVGGDLSGGHPYRSLATFKRVRTVMKTLVAQLDVLETMSPMEFMTFRDRLESASGFQSVQFRELEFLLGHKRPAMVRHHKGNAAAVGALERRLDEPSIVDHFYGFLETQGVSLPQEVRDKDVRAPTQPSEPLQDALVELYRSRPDLMLLFESMMDFDEGLQEWRYRHVKMVQRTIGDKRGTGGSPGVKFLMRTLGHPVFPDLWAIRNRI